MPDLTYDQYIDVYAANVGLATADESFAVVELDPKERILDVIVPYGDDGLYLAYGRNIVRPKQTSESPEIYQFADPSKHTLGTLHSVKSVQFDGTEAVIAASDYAYDANACTLQINTSHDGTIECDIDGQDNANTFGTIVPHLLNSWAGIPNSEIDSVAFGDIPIVPLSLWENRPRALSSIITSIGYQQASLERSISGLVYQAPNGIWTCRGWTPDLELRPIAHLYDNDFQLFRPKPRHAHSIYGVVRVYYGRDLRTGEWKSVEERNNTIIAELGHDNPYEVYTYLTTESDARTLGQRVLFSLTIPPIDIEFIERGNKLANAKLRDRVDVTYSRAPSQTGNFVGRTFEITALRRSLTPGFTISGVLSSIRLSQNFGAWVSDIFPTFANADEEQRLDAGFWTDDNGHIGDFTDQISNWL